MIRSRRRDVLRGALLAALALVAPSGLLAAPAAGELWPWSGRGRRGARAVGRAYLRGRPQEADAERLRSLLREGAGRPAPEELRRRVRRDFARGEVVQVGGWVLSRTEARLCALAALGG